MELAGDDEDGFLVVEKLGAGDGEGVRLLGGGGERGEGEEGGEKEFAHG